jgi:hypothetical protein
MMQTLQRPRIKLVPAKWIFIGALLIMTGTILTVYLTGFNSSRSLVENAAISLSILSTICFGFLTASLYYGIKLKDDVGDLTRKVKWLSNSATEVVADVPDVAGKSGGKGSILPDLDIGDGADEIAAAVFAWIAVTITFIAFLFLFETVIWAFVLLIAAMLYWVFFRAVRLVLKNSPKCRGNFSKAALYGLGYTLLYSSWMYAILLCVKYLK